MTPQIDLFHELVYRSPEGFVAIRNYTEQFPKVDIFTPFGEWFGSSGAINPGTMMNDIKRIIAWRINWEQKQVNKSDHELNELNEL